ncbi:MAG TPA: cupredoxin domain-containing protein [Bacteroidetes bacterium]|nr:cupredoxin domain-containing protein [Bacteroidota bacterium]
MGTPEILVTVTGLGLMALTAWYFWFSGKRSVRANITSNVQEIMVKVKGGYSPDVIVVKAGKPVRLNFYRQETAACSEMVLFPDFQKSAKLPTGKIVPVEFTPEVPGEYQFACQMGMLRGKLVVE